MTVSFDFAATKRLASAHFYACEHVDTELSLVPPLAPSANWIDISSQMMKGALLEGEEEEEDKCRTRAIFLDSEGTFLFHRNPVNYYMSDANSRYRIRVHMKVSKGTASSGSRENEQKKIIVFDLYPAPASRPGDPLPALEYLIDRLGCCPKVHWFAVSASHRGDSSTRIAVTTLDVSSACFENLLQRSRRQQDTSSLSSHTPCSVILNNLHLTADQSARLMTHNSPTFLRLDYCSFQHEPAACSVLRLTEAEVALSSSSCCASETNAGLEVIRPRLDDSTPDTIVSLLRNQHLVHLEVDLKRRDVELLTRELQAVSSHYPYRIEKNGAGIECLNLFMRCEFVESGEVGVLMWTNFWKAVGSHPSLKEVNLTRDARNNLPCRWWEAIAAAVKANPQLVLVTVWVNDRYRSRMYQGWETMMALFDAHVEPLLERNRTRPAIAALCSTNINGDPRNEGVTAALLGQALVSVTNNNRKAKLVKLEIQRILVHELVLSGHTFSCSN
jgi:hypothetical protein